jgi:hypothetical protein
MDHCEGVDLRAKFMEWAKQFGSRRGVAKVGGLDECERSTT